MLAIWFVGLRAKRWLALEMMLFEVKITMLLP